MEENATAAGREDNPIPCPLLLPHILPPSAFPAFASEPLQQPRASTSTLDPLEHDTCPRFPAMPAVVTGNLPSSSLLNIAGGWTATPGENEHKQKLGGSSGDNQSKGCTLLTGKTQDPLVVLVLSPSRARLHHNLIVEDSMYWREQGGEAIMSNKFDKGTFELRYCDTAEKALLLLTMLHTCPQSREDNGEPSNPFDKPPFSSHRLRTGYQDDVTQVPRGTSLIIAHDLLSLFADQDGAVEMGVQANEGDDGQESASTVKAEGTTHRQLAVLPGALTVEEETRPTKKRKKNADECWREGACIEDYLSLMATFRQTVQQLAEEADHPIHGLVLEPTAHAGLCMPLRAANASFVSFSPAPKDARQRESPPPALSPREPRTPKRKSNPFSQNFSPSASPARTAGLGYHTSDAAQQLPGMTGSPSPSPVDRQDPEASLRAGIKTPVSRSHAKRRAAGNKMDEMKVLHGLDWLFGDVASIKYQASDGTRVDSPHRATGVCEVIRDVDENPFLDAAEGKGGPASDKVMAANASKADAGASVVAYRIKHCRTGGFMGRFSEARTVDEGTVYEWRDDR